MKVMRRKRRYLLLCFSFIFLYCRIYLVLFLVFLVLVWYVKHQETVNNTACIIEVSLAIDMGSYL